MTETERWLRDNDTFDMVSRKQHLELRERKGVLLPQEREELHDVRRRELLNWYHRMILATPQPRQADYPTIEKWFRSCDARESVIQQYSREYTEADLALES